MQHGRFWRDAVSQVLLRLTYTSLETSLSFRLEILRPQSPLKRVPVKRNRFAALPTLMCHRPA